MCLPPADPKRTESGSVTARDRCIRLPRVLVPKRYPPSLVVASKRRTAGAVFASGLSDVNRREGIGLLLVGDHPNGLVTAEGPHVRDPVVHFRAATAPTTKHVD